jgi:hypothetical protein
MQADKDVVEFSEDMRQASSRVSDPAVGSN